jgi:hypothetical protein
LQRLPSIADQRYSVFIRGEILLFVISRDDGNLSF